MQKNSDDNDKNNNNTFSVCYEKNQDTGKQN